MSRRSTLPVALIALIVLVVLAVLVRCTGPEHGLEPGAPEPVGAASADTAAPLVPGAPDTPLAGDAGPDEPGTARASAAEPESEDAAVASRAVDGRVVLPRGTPGDERVVVFALTEAQGLARLAGEGGQASRAWRGEVTDAGPLLAAVEVADDGRFRLELPERADDVHLALCGRYVFSRQTTPWSEGDVPTLTGELGTWVTGTLVAPEDASPLQADFEWVRVELGPDVTGGFDATAMARGGVTLVTEAAADGAFEFRGVPVGMRRGVVVKHDHLAARLELGLTPVAGEHIELTLPLRRGATVAGRVSHEDGHPIGGARVEVRYRGPLGDGVGTLRSGTSEDDGSFVLEHVAVGAVELVVTRKGLRPATVPLELVDGGVVDDVFVTLEAGLGIVGRAVFADGEPAHGAWVQVGPDLSSVGGADSGRLSTAGSGGTEADADGRFAVRGLSRAPYAVTATWKPADEDDSDSDGEGDGAAAPAPAPDARDGTWRARATGVRAGADELELVLEPVNTLAGRVTDLAGEPLESFRVTCTLEDSGGLFGIGAERPRAGFTDASDGAFEVIGLAAGRWEADVAAEGYATSATQVVTLPQPPDLARPTFALEPAAAVEGLVLDTADVPLAGARVTLKLDLGRRMAAMQEGGPPAVHSDVDGRFRLADLDPGALQLVASFEGFATSEPHALDLVAGETTRDVVLRLRTGGVLTGEVLDDDGEPHVGRMVIVQRTPDYEPQHMVPSDARGTFRLEHLEPGTWQVVATANFLTEDLGEGEEAVGSILDDMQMELVEIVDGEETHVVLGAPPADPVQVQGRVTHAGEPVTDAFVSFMPEDPQGLGDMKFKPVDADGRFELELDQPGRYLVTVQHQASMGRQNSVEFQETVPDAEEHRLDLRLPLGRVEGRVLGPGGERLAGCRVTLHVEDGVAYGSFLGGHYTEVVTDDEGNYAVPFLGPGSYTVAAGGAPLGGAFGQEARAGRQVRSGVRVPEGRTVGGVDFRLERPGEVGGVVSDATGAAVAGAAIFVRDDDGRLLERFSLVTTDGAGRFTYPGVAPGDYTVSARREGLASDESAEVHVPEGGRGTVEVTLEAATVLRVVVVDREGREVRARLRVLDADSRDVGVMRSMEEIMAGLVSGLGREQRFGPLPAGTYRVEAVADDGRSVRKNVTLRGQPERKLNLRLK